MRRFPASIGGERLRQKGRRGRAKLNIYLQEIERCQRRMLICGEVKREKEDARRMQGRKRSSLPPRQRATEEEDGKG